MAAGYGTPGAFVHTEVSSQLSGTEPLSSLDSKRLHSPPHRHTQHLLTPHYLHPQRKPSRNVLLGAPRASYEG